MRYFYLLLLTITITSCKQEEQPISTENLSEEQVDSLAQELNFNYGEPIEVLNSEIVFIPIKNKVTSWKKSLKKYDSYREETMYIAWNALFYDRETDSSYVLTEDKMYLLKMDVPTRKEDHIKNHILYEVISRDTNKDSLLNYSDATSLYVSDLNGQNFKKITKDNESLQSYQDSDRAGEIFFKTIIDSNADNEYDDKDSEQWYLYNVNNGTAPKPIVDPKTELEIGKLFIKNWVK